MKKDKHTLNDLLIKRAKLQNKLSQLDVKIFKKQIEDGIIEIELEGDWVNFTGEERNETNKLDKFRYPVSGKWKDKIFYVIAATGKPLTASEVTRKIFEKEENKDVDYDPIVRLNINRMVGKEDIVKFKIKNLSNYYYALPHWKLDKYR